MTNIIDRRSDSGDSVPNRKKFLDRHQRQIKEAMKDSIKNISITDMDSESVEVSISGDLEEPTFEYERGTGKSDIVLPGNKEFSRGDELDKPRQSGGGRGKQGSAGGDGEDEFTFTIDSSEFMDLFFSDLELPNMDKMSMSKEVSESYSKAGYSISGSPSNINLKETFKKSFGRRLAMRGSILAQIEEAKKNEDWELVEELEKKLLRVSFLEDTDLKFDYYEVKPEVKHNAVVFCLMDVSASMGDNEKDLAKRFFALLYLFLKKNYTNTDVVFIRHTDSAKEVGEKEFFYSRQTGGTVMSSGLEMINKIVADRYPSDIWNVYVAQASDGGNFDFDNQNYLDLLKNKVLPLSQFYVYIEIINTYTYFTKSGIPTSDIYNSVHSTVGKLPNFKQGVIETPGDIWPLFKSLFKKKRGNNG